MKKSIPFSGSPRTAIVIPQSYPDDWVINWHHHDFAQLVYACSGVMTVETADNHWVVPPQRAVWIPPYIDHRVTMYGQAEMRNLYVSVDGYQQLPEKSCVLNVSPLLRELILHLAVLTKETEKSGEAERLFLVILDQLKRANEMTFYLPMPTDVRLKHVCESILEHPDDNRTLAEWAAYINISSRSLSRLLRKDIGLSFVEYRQQARLFLALKLLAKGLPVSTVAMEVGFSSLSAFNHLFKKNFGQTPGHIFDAS
ncbi:AraC family transcriptional regulator [Kistimonas asteriae]|uniref:AraC family transcriptional regulator n=1 Tax=Kistimonas asteriae TaxID=517724 RepID=UPI001BAA5FDB|nr:helix-turn-helix transcriptional regulator [Kistimonas asteriae]